MTLSPLDDYPIHQIAQPVRHAGTSDRNFYDRYYFNAHRPDPDGRDGSTLVIAGMGQYPNLSVADAFVAVLHDGVHRVLRASKVLGDDRMDTEVGPIRVEVLEGLRRIRLVAGPNDFGVECDLTFEGMIHPHEEPQQVIRAPGSGRAMLDTFRLVQTGVWTGHVSVEGASIDVTPDEWSGVRDRSWGVRPVGEAEAPGVAATRGGSFYWVYAPLRFAEFTIVVIVQEGPDGRRIMEDATRVWNLGPDGSPGVEEPLGSPEVELEFEPGTRTVTGATIRFSRSDLTVRVDPIAAMHIGVGSGYGFDGDWRHGEFRGDPWVDGARYDLSDPEDQKKMWGIVDTLPRAETSAGDVGYGLFEYLFLGPHERHGWKDLLDAP